MWILYKLISYVKREKSVSESLHFLPSYLMFYPDPPREGNLGLVSGACNRIRITMRKIRIQFSGDSSLLAHEGRSIYCFIIYGTQLTVLQSRAGDETARSTLTKATWYCTPSMS